MALRATLAVQSGMKVRGVMDLVFSPAIPSSSNGEGDTSDPLWLDPLIRWASAALLDIYARHMPADRYQPAQRFSNSAKLAVKP